MSETIRVRFRNPWFCNTDPAFPNDRITGATGAPLQRWSGRLYERFNANDERTVYTFPASWRDRLPRTAEVEVNGAWEKALQEAKEKRTQPPKPMNFKEAREHLGLTEEPEVRMAEIEAKIREEVKAELKAEEAARKEEIKDKKRKSLEKARAAKAAKQNT